MSLDGIDVFVEVVNSKSFSRAAASLGMPTTTVSAKVARLEKRLGVSLIRRTTRQLFVTEAGQRYYEQCATALLQISDAESELAQLVDEPFGTLHITAPADLANSILQPVIERYLERYPKVSVRISVTNSHLDLVAEGIDLAVRVGRIKAFSLTVKKFMVLTGSLWASQDYLERFGHPVSIEDLAEHRLIEFTAAGDSFPMVSDTGVEERVNFRARINCDDMQTSKTFAENSAGIAILPDVVATYHRGASPALVRVLPGYKTPTLTANLVYPSQRFIPKTVRAFIDLATQKRVDAACM